MEFKNFINQKFIEFEQRMGGRQTVTDFAKYLQENQGNVSHWLNGTRVPQKKVLDRMAKILGPEVYAAAGYIEPMPDDPLLRRAIRAMRNLPVAEKEHLANMAEKMAREEPQQSGDNRSSFQFAGA